MKWVLIFVGIAAFLGSSLVSANSLTERQFRQLEKAQELVAEEKYSEALEETDPSSPSWLAQAKANCATVQRGSTAAALATTVRAISAATTAHQDAQLLLAFLDNILEIRGLATAAAAGSASPAGSAHATAPAETNNWN